MDDFGGGYGGDYDMAGGGGGGGGGFVSPNGGGDSGMMSQGSGGGTGGKKRVRGRTRRETRRFVFLYGSGHFSSRA